MKYYLHDSNSFQDEKITELYIQFGYEGVGLFYTLLEKIALQEKPVKTEVLKRQLNVGKRLMKCWNFMQEIDLIQVKNGETFNENILNFSETYQIKKEKNRKKISEWRGSQKDMENVTSYVPKCNRPKVNKSKVNKSKVSSIIPDTGNENDKQLNFLDQILQAFKNEYFAAFGIEYIITNKGKENAAISKLLKMAKEKNPQATSDEMLNSFISYFRRCMAIEDQWIRDHVSPTIILSKFNEINKIIKHGKSTSRNAAISFSEIEAIVDAAAAGRR